MPGLHAPRGPRSNRTSVSVASLALAVALVAGACSSGDSSSSKTTVASGTDVYELIFGSPKEQAAKQDKVQQLVRSCMVAKGWEYTPVDNAQFSSPTQQAAATETLEYAKENGYGISTVEQAAQGAGTVSDPNKPYVDGLSATDREQYTKDLYGDARSGGTSTGCYQDASRQVFGSTGQADSSLTEALSTLEEQIAGDSRISAATTKWASCMRKKGFDYSSPEAAQDAISSEYESLLDTGTDAGGSSAGDDGSTSGTVTPAGGTGAAASAGDAVADPAALKALQRKEIETAVADVECSEATIKPVLAKVRKEYEARFVSEHPELKKGS